MKYSPRVAASSTVGPASKRAIFSSIVVGSAVAVDRSSMNEAGSS
jgi:hypothetical protein